MAVTRDYSRPPAVYYGLVVGRQSLLYVDVVLATIWMPLVWLSVAPLRWLLAKRDRA